MEAATENSWPHWWAGSNDGLRQEPHIREMQGLNYDQEWPGERPNNDWVGLAAGMADEIFGPVLPMLRYRDLDAVVGHIARGDKPLSLYCFTADSAVQLTSDWAVYLTAPLLTAARPRVFSTSGPTRERTRRCTCSAAAVAARAVTATWCT